MSKKINSAFVAALLMVLGCQWTVANGQNSLKRDSVPIPVVDIDTIMKHIVELSSETYEGRLAGSEGYNRAMRYVEREMARYGVRPVDGKKWERPFALECNEVENAKFNTYMPGSKHKRVFSLGNEFCCAGATGRGYVDAQMVFCGYGVDNALMNEYAGVDAKGKIVVVLTGLPESHPMPQGVADRYVSLRDKARAAERHGAIGMLVVTVSPTCPADEPQGRAWCGELPHMPTFPVLILSHDCGREIFNGEQMELDSAIAMIDAQGWMAEGEENPHFPLFKKAEIDINARYSPQASTANVVGILEGADPMYSREIIVVGASMDGLGQQGGTCLFPGADINASGVATVLEVARVLSDSDYRPRRSVAFVLFSGSEQQYLGSRQFVGDFPLLRRVEAFVGVQNVGSGDSIVVMGGGRFPTLYDIAWRRDTIGARNKMVAGGKKSYARGDARAFDAIGIPSLMFTTQDGMRHNHTTTDMWENIDRRILVNVSQLVAETVAQLGEGLYQGRSQQSRLLRE